jgi:transcriptional regulator with PAS, ATPase and Fis domain
LIGVSASTEALRQAIALAAGCEAKVLILGETGVGKEVVAHLIHRHSRRQRAPFLTINCAGVPDTLLESQFFGHARGSFTDAHRDHPGFLRQAHGGSVFLDEVGEMTPRLQGLLLRFLETGEVPMIGGRSDVVDVRVIAATNRELSERTATGEFRLDLFYRLNVIRIDIPPLRERREDIPALVDHFLDVCTGEHHTAVPVLLPEAVAALRAYHWPGNVRELRNVMERIVIRATGGRVSVGDLPSELSRTRSTVTSTDHDATPSMPVSVQELWRRLVVEHESFWTSVYPQFRAHALTRDDLRRLIAQGLRETRGFYRALLALFNMPGADYKRFMNFLDSHDCKLPPHDYRTGRRRDSAPNTTLRGQGEGL